MTTVDRIKMICKERKIPISKLEKECGFANGYISGLKKGSIPDDRLNAISTYLEIEPFELSTGEKREIPRIDFTTEEGLLIEMYSKINKEQKAAVFSLIRSMLSEN